MHFSLSISAGLQVIKEDEGYIPCVSL